MLCMPFMTHMRLAGRLAPVVSQKATFFEALICNVPPEARLLTAFQGDSPLPAHLPGLARGAVPHMGAAAAQMGPCPYPDIEAFITSICNQARIHKLFLILPINLTSTALQICWKLPCTLDRTGVVCAGRSAGLCALLDALAGLAPTAA